MKKKILLFILPVFLGVGIIIYHSSYNKEDILNIKIDLEKILKSSSYSYLSKNVKDYIVNYYNETGEVLLTEKNKVNGKVYLNPDYIAYLEDETYTDMGYVPNALTYDSTYILGSSNSNDLPKKYDSRNVNGNNYVTSTKRQYSELCWNYAFTSVIESKLLKEGLKTDPLSLDLSERMMDYATSDPISGIDIGKNPYYGNYALNGLADGGNEYRYSSVLVNGLFPIDESNWQYELEYMGKVKPEDIYDFNKTKYQVNEVKFIKDNNYIDGFDEDTNNLLKQYLIDNGSVGVSLRVGAGRNYVRYKVAVGEELNSGNQYNYLYYKDVSAVYQSNDHMVAIIGWDDDYLHNVCVLENGELTDAINNNGVYTCTSGNLKTINGAWIIKDSANSSFHYLAYETTNSQYFIVTDISYKDWDNVYSSSNNTAYTKNANTYIFNKQNNSETVKSIKFYATANVTNLSFYINTYDGTGEKLLTTISTDTGGMYTIPITNEIILSSDKFSIRVSGSLNGNFSIFTNNHDEDILVDIEDAGVVNSFNYQNLLDDYQNVIVINGISRNINDTVKIIIKDSNGGDVTKSFNIIRNYAIGNYINSLIRFDNNIPLGEYSGYLYVNDSLYEMFKININKYMENVKGKGTEESPYIITNPVQLDMIRLNKYNYYKLGNDIDLTYDTQNKNGLFYNEGLGWEPISYSTCTTSKYVKASCSDGFAGILDGNNYKIIGLYINRPNENIVGLFKNTYNSVYSGLNFRNLTLKDVNITGNNYVGGLIGYAYGTTYERTLIFENIAVTGNVSGNDYIGGIIGYFKGGTGLNNYLVKDTKCVKRHCLNNLFNSSKITGNNYVGGIIGLLETQDYYNSTNANWRSTIDAYNWQNNGLIVSQNNASGLVGHMAISNGNTITLNNAINTGMVKSEQDVAIVNDLECTKSNNTYPNCSLVLNNIYYINDTSYNSNSFIKANNVKKYSVVELTNSSIYSSFIDFNTYYKQETINNIKRIPFLKNAYLEYSNAHDIFIKNNNTINLYDYVDGSNNILYQVADESIASIDNNGVITPLKSGTTSVHITSYYDGYDNDIALSVDLSNIEYTITYNLNGGSGTNPTSYKFNNDTFTLSIPTKEGYIFTGWTGSNGSNLQIEVSITKDTMGDLVYNANWEPIKYNLIFNENSGTGTMPKQEVTYDNLTKINKNTFIKEHYEFIGWNTKPDGTGISYQDGQEIKNLTTKIEDIILYAQWEKIISEIKDYKYDENNNFIIDIVEKTSVDKYKSKFTISTNYDIEIYDLDNQKIKTDDLIFTGSITKVVQNGEVVDEYINIVKGDINGTGTVTVADVSMLYSHVRGTNSINKDYYLMAGDTNNSSSITVADVSKIYSYVRTGLDLFS